MPWRTAAARAARREEAKLHRLCVKLLRERLPDVVTYRHDGGVQLASSWHYRLRKMEGSTKGAPDLFIAQPGRSGRCGLFVELKSLSGVLTHDQNARIAHLQEVGYRCGVVRNKEQFLTLLSYHLESVCATPTTLPC